MSSSHFGFRNLKELIKESGYTQRSLSEVVNIPEGTINSWVAGRYRPEDIDRIILLSKVLKVSLKELLRAFGYCVDGIPDD